MKKTRRIIFVIVRMSKIQNKIGERPNPIFWLKKLNKLGQTNLALCQIVLFYISLEKVGASALSFFVI